MEGDGDVRALAQWLEATAVAEVGPAIAEVLQSAAPPADAPGAAAPPTTRVGAALADARRALTGVLGRLTQRPHPAVPGAAAWHAAAAAASPTATAALASRAAAAPPCLRRVVLPAAALTAAQLPRASLSLRASAYVLDFVPGDALAAEPPGGGGRGRTGILRRGALGGCLGGPRRPPAPAFADAAPAAMARAAAGGADGVCRLGEVLQRTLWLSLAAPAAAAAADGGSLRVEARVLAVSGGGAGSCDVTVEPTAAMVRTRGEPTGLRVRVTPRRPGARLRLLLLIEVGGGALRLPVLLRLTSERRVHGVPLRLLLPASGPRADRIGVPAAWRQLRVRLERDSALSAEGIFRLAPSAADALALRAELDAGVYVGADDVRPPAVAAHALKALLRELSPPLLAPLPVEALLGLGRGSAPARELIAALPPVEAAALSWLIDLLARAAAHEPHSRMGARALAVCVAPNLLSLDASGDNPMLALALVTKAAELLHTLIADAGTPLGAAAVSLSPQSPLQEPLHDDDGGTDDELPQPPLAADTASPLAPEVLSPARSPASQPPATGVWSAVTVGSPVVAADSPARA